MISETSLEGGSRLTVSGTTYRTEVDGLRAVAVLLVTLFHLDIAAFAGGYVGVDVFFVISGYLITRNILREGAAFKFSTFYWRRARRLMPAVWATVAVTTMVASVVMQPEALHATAWSAVATTFSVSNFYFWFQSGYWDTGAALKPLLHTWSLAVEEQFYLLWPLLLFLLRPLHGRHQLTMSFVGLFIAGTTLSVWATDRYPSAAFYLMPFRVMEFAIGAALAGAEFHRRHALPAVVEQVLPASGLALIVLSALTFDDKTAFPGIAAVVPCLGTALVIFARSGTATSVALSHPLATYLGRISYSLYLVHWPVVSLYKYTTLDVMTPLTQLALFAVMLALAAMLHHLIEKPFRYGSTPSPALVMGIAAVFTLALPLTFVVQIGTSAATERRGASGNAGSGSVTWHAALEVPRQKFYDDRLRYVCSINEPSCNEPAPGRLNILVIGDSHGADAHTIMQTAFPEAHIVPGGRAGCMSFVGAEQWYIDQKHPDNDDRRGCLWNVDRIYGNKAMLQKINIVAFNFLPTGVEYPLLDQTLAYLATVTKARVVVFGTGPWFEQELPDVVRVKGLTPDEVVPSEFVKPQTWTSDDQLKAVAAKHGALFVSKLDFFCPDRACKPFTPDRSSLISYDRDHLSFDASAALGRAVTPLLKPLAK